MKMEQIKQEKLKEHYFHHKDKSFFGELIRYMSSVPSVLLVLQGKEAVDVVRKMAGVTSGRKAEPGTIRGDFSMSIQVNTIHASESVDAAKSEIKRFFGEKEVLDYSKVDVDWVYSPDEKE